MTLLTDFPPELLVCMFSHQSNMEQVIRLSRTCHKLRHIWTKDIPRIRDAVLSRQLICYRTAKQLLHYQLATWQQIQDRDFSASERAHQEGLSKFITEDGLSLSEDITVAQSAQTRRLVENDREAKWVADRFMNTYLHGYQHATNHYYNLEPGKLKCIRDGCKHSMTYGQRERSRMVYAFYLCKMYTLSHFSQELRPQMDAMMQAKSFREGWMIGGMMMAICNNTDCELCEELCAKYYDEEGMGDEMPEWDEPWDAMGKVEKRKQDCMRAQDLDLLEREEEETCFKAKMPWLFSDEKFGNEDQW